MKKSKNTREPPSLRERAEAQLKHTSRPRSAPADERKLLHELETHQIELEMQNEELRETRQDLEISSARYVDLFDFAPIGYVVLNADGTIRELNMMAARSLGEVRSRLIGRRLVLFVRVADRNRLSELLARLLTMADEARESCEVSLAVDPPTEVLITARYRSAGSAILLAMQDVTARKEAEAALRQANSRKDEFLAVLSHELRNPLMPIRMSLSVLQQTAMDQRGRQALTIIDRQTSYLTRIVDDLLDINRIVRGKVLLQPELLDFTQLVRRTVDDHRSGLENGGIELEYRCEAESCWIEGDAIRLTQVLGNLLANAGKFTPRGGRVDLHLRHSGAWAELSLHDTGAGMTSTMLAHAFEPFMQELQPVNRPLGGLGLGLAMVKGLVELHGGSVGLTSGGPGQGTTAVVRLPLAAPPDATTSAADPPQVGRHRVLIIEDNLDAADSLKEVLELSGQEVQVAYDGPSGLARAREFRPELVFCDIGLPQMDGYAVAKAFRAEAGLERTYLVALSGYALSEDLRRATEAGFDRHVAKPISFEKLQELLSSVQKHAVATR